MKKHEKEKNNSDRIWKWFCLSYSVMSVLISVFTLHSPYVTHFCVEVLRPSQLNAYVTQLPGYVKNLIDSFIHSKMGEMQKMFQLRVFFP